MRSNSFPLLGCVTIISLMLLSFTITKSNYQTECVNIEMDGYVTIKIWDSQKGTKYSHEHARKDAIHALLFSGIAAGNGCVTQPAILKNSEDQENFRKIEKDFFSKNGSWSMYTKGSATETTLPTNLGVKNWKVYQVSVSKNALRQFLEEQKIIKSLTNGF